MDPTTITLKCSDGRIFHTPRAMIKQLNQLTTMLDAYEDCEVTEPLLLERIDGDMMATVLEWCTSFLGKCENFVLSE